LRPLDPRHREVARRLVAAGPEADGRDIISSAAALVEALEPHLQNLIGRVGMRALEGRALRLAKSDHPVLDPLQVQQDGDGVMAGLAGLAARSEPEELRAGIVALIGHLVGLLASLLGEEITLRLLRRTCPRVELEDAMLEESPGGAE
jgi:hypothetical protein